MRRLFLLLLAALPLACQGTSCHRAAVQGPLPLLRQATTAGSLAPSGTVAMAADSRPALLASAAWEVTLPARPLLTYGMGLSWTGDLEPPGWFQLTVKAGGKVLHEQRLNPRAARVWRDIALPLPGLGPRATLEFELALHDRWGKPTEKPAGLLLAVADPTVHDLDAYGKSKGVVVVSIDTLRRDHVGAYGYAKPTTPRLDALARQGLLAEDAVSTSSWTLPAHTSLLTSADPGAHGAVDMEHGFNRRLPTLPALLRKAGFATQAVTSHLYVSGVYGLDEGFDHLDFSQDRKAAEVADRAIALLDRFGDRPFFVFLHFYDPHWHYAPPPETEKLFAKPYAGTLTGNWQDFSQKGRESLSPEDIEHLLALYDGEIRYTDDQLGRVLDHLKARGLDGSTLLVVTSDHGEEFLEHGGWEHQRTLYEEVVRVPLLVKGPGLAPRREGQQASLLDVAPTVLAHAGVAPGTALGGRSLLAALPEREAYGETDHTVDHSRKLFLRAGAGRWKYVASLDRASQAVLAEEWFDLLADPGETRSLPPPGAAADAIRARALDRWRSSRGKEGPPVSLTPEQRERLRALGYVTP